ncbi:MAG: 30S ribosomal protein S7 [Patescibacteria group bacterium]|nr:30S ribosomal protein S7 [Patescibacteria group bacterium]
MRRPIKRKHIVEPDLKYNSVKLEKFINYIMQWGQKDTARKVVYAALEEVKEKTKQEPLEVFEAALRNVSPNMEIRSRRVGGANYQVPREVRPERRQSLAYRWMIDAARARKGMPMHKRLAEELIAASNNQGSAVKKREDTHKMAEANKAFAHFAW